jgi:hypothetical protein
MANEQARPWTMECCKLGGQQSSEQARPWRHSGALPAWNTIFAEDSLDLSFV